MAPLLSARDARQRAADAEARAERCADEARFRRDRAADTTDDSYRTRLLRHADRLDQLADTCRRAAAAHRTSAAVIESYRPDLNR